AARRRADLLRHPPIGRPLRVVTDMMVALPAVKCSPHARVQLGQRHVQRRETILSGGLGPDRRAAGHDREFYPLLLTRLPGVALDRHFHIDSDRLLVQLLQLLQLGSGEILEPSGHVRLPTVEDDFHELSPLPSDVEAAPVRPTWSSTPHPPAEGFAALVPLVPFSPLEGYPIPGRGQDL